MSVFFSITQVQDLKRGNAIYGRVTCSALGAPCDDGPDLWCRIERRGLWKSYREC